MKTSSNSLLEAVCDVLHGKQLNEQTIFAFTDHLKPTKLMKKMIEAQEVGKPLRNQDDTEIEGTVYLGDGAYLAKDKKGNLVLSTFGRTRASGDGTLTWDKYLSYDNPVAVSATVLKNALKFSSKI